MANKVVTYKKPDGTVVKREIDPGIYGQLSKEGLQELQKMMGETMPAPKKKKQAVRRPADKK